MCGGNRSEKFLEDVKDKNINFPTAEVEPKKTASNSKIKESLFYARTRYTHPKSLCVGGIIAPNVITLLFSFHSIHCLRCQETVSRLRNPNK